MTLILKKLTIAACVFSALAGCSGHVALKDASGQDLIGKKAYTQFNLYPDRTRGRLYTLNYLLPDAMIPRCSEVELLEMNRKVLVLREVSSGRQFNYLLHKATGEPIEVSAAKTFASSCDQNAVKTMSKADREGISSGKLAKGMSKQGVLLAAGYPPAHRTPSLDGNEWTYWKNRFNTLRVIFNDQGIVTQVID